jgi:hypothetical protein
MPSLVQISQPFIFSGYRHQVSDTGSIRGRQVATGNGVRVCVLDFVAALFAFAYYVCDAAEDPFTFLGAAFVAIEDVGAEGELEAAGAGFVCWGLLFSGLWYGEGGNRDREGDDLPSTLDATLSAPSSSFTLTSLVLVTLLSLFLSLLFPSTPNLSVSVFCLVGPGLGLSTLLATSSSTSILPAFLFRVAFLPLELLWERDNCRDSSEASRSPARIFMLSRRDISSDLPSIMWLTSSLIFTFSR